MSQQTLNRRTLLAGIAGLAGLPLTALPLTGCASRPRPAVSPPDLVRASGVARQRASASAPVHAVTDGMVAFGHALCRANAVAGANWVASPLSIACAFAMARVGARGATARSLDRFFGYPATGRDDAFNAITKAVTTTDGPPGPPPAPPSLGELPAPPVVTLGNALFVRRGLDLQTVPAYSRDAVWSRRPPRTAGLRRGERPHRVGVPR